MSNKSLFVPDQKKLIKENVFKQLERFVAKGKLDPYNSEILLLEKVSLILYFYHTKLGYSYTIEEFRLPRLDVLYPIDLVDLRDRLYRFSAKEHYKWSGVDRGQIGELVEKAMKNPEEIPEYSFTGDAPPFGELSKIVDILLAKGLTRIDDHYLPLPDVSIAEARAFYKQNRKRYFSQIRKIQFSESGAKLYITAFFRHLESCYKDFVDYCFPTLKGQLPFYANLPHEYFFYMLDSSVRKRCWFGNRSSKDRKVNFTFKNYTSLEQLGEEDGITQFSTFSLDMILFISNPVQTVDRVNTSSVDKYCVIRNWMYKLLKSDLEGIFKSMDI